MLATRFFCEQLVQVLVVHCPLRFRFASPPLLFYIAS